VLRSRLKSFSYAFAGLKQAFLEEPNFRIHIVATLITLGLGWYCEISRIDWAIVVITIGVVIITELLNTAVENLCDHVTPAQDPMIKKIKDVSAAAVLCSALMAVCVGIFLFWPYVATLF